MRRGLKLLCFDRAGCLTGFFLIYAAEIENGTPLRGASHWFASVWLTGGLEAGLEVDTSAEVAVNRGDFE